MLSDPTTIFSGFREASMRWSFCILLCSGIAIASVITASPTMSQESEPRDPPNGFVARDRGAMRLSGAQAGQLKLISAAPLSRFYPREPLTRRQVGKAMIDLLIDASGIVVDVRVLDEEPLGMGFGDAAAASARTYKFYNPFNRLVTLATPVKFVP